MRLVLIEDSERDIELIRRELRRAHIEPEIRAVQSEPELRRALEEFQPQIILSDFTMPHFNGMDALALARELCPETPFIFVSGTLGEEHAIGALKNGATDYVLKSNLVRLPAAVERALTDIRERESRRQAEIALEASEGRYRATFEQAAVGIVHSSLRGEVQMVNQTFCEMCGYDRADLKGASLQRLIHPEDLKLSFLGRADLLVATGASYQRELRLVRRNGTHLWANVTSSLMRGPDGKPSHFISVLNDTTERRQAERELRRFRLALDHSDDIFLIIDRATMHHVDVNDAACRLLGYSREELLRIGPNELVNVKPGELERTYDALIANPDQQSGMRGTYRCRDGSLLPFESTRHVLRSDDGWLIVAVSRDIRERLEAERALRESEGGLRRAQEIARLAHVVNSAEGAFESWSETLPRMLGVAANALPRSTREWLPLLHPDDRERFREASIASARTGKRLEQEYRLKRADGAWMHIRQQSEPIEGSANAQGRSRWFATLQDVTLEKRADEALQLSEERHRSMFEQAAVGIVHTSLDGRIVLVNPAFARLSGYSREEAAGLHIRDFTHPDDFARSAQGRDQLLSGTSLPYQRELRLALKGGAELWASVTTSLVRDAAGQPAYFISIVQDVSERKRAEHEVLRFQLAMDVSVDSIYLTDPKTMRFLYVNDTACQRLGYSREELLKKDSFEVVGGGREQVRREYEQVIAAGERGLSFERRFMRADGSQGWTEVHRRALQADGDSLIVSIGRDVTERRMAEDRIRHLNRMYAVLSGVNALVVRVRGRDELYREACRVAVEIGGFKTAWIGAVDRVAGSIVPVAWHGVDEDYIHRMPLQFEGDKPSLAAQAVKNLSAVVVDDMAVDPRVLLRQEAGEREFHSLAILPLVVAGEAVGALALYAAEIGFFDEEEKKLLLQLAGDLSFALEHIEKSEKLEYLAFHDVLTGLPNRALFQERLSQLLATAAEGRKLAVLVVDLERFRTVNDTLGRQAGDDLLKQITERARRAKTASGWMARIGADQFASIVTEFTDADGVVRRIEQRTEAILGEPFRLGDSDVRIAAKFGIALFPEDGADADTLLRNAEAALKKAKASGDRYLFYAQEMTARVAENLALETKLRQALEREEFVLHYQPKVDAEQRRVVGVEGLIRWQSPERGLVPPGHFIPLLEETGLILQVGAWAMRRAVLDHRHWLRQGVSTRIAVNVSSIQLRQRDFVDVIKEAIAQGANPNGLDLEITESLLMDDIKGNIAKLKAVRDLGVKIAIDDFGTGYSSLGYLAQLPVQTLKIDRSFVITMLKDPNAMTLVQTIISLAHSLRLTVVAEGVETEEQARMLRLLRCDEIQGYLISKPVPMEELTPLLRSSGVRKEG